MFRRKLKNSFYLTIFLISIFSISFGYALLNSTLIIMGTSAIQKNTWDVHFENLKVKEGSVTATTAPSITDSNRISDFTFILDKRGDYYEFTVDIVNSGSLDAMIDSVEMTPSLTTEQEKYLTYTITYENNAEIKKNQLVKVNDFVRIKVRVEFKSDITASDLPQTQQVLNLGFVVNYIQAEDNGDFVDNNGKLVKVVSGSGTNTGDEVCFASECFYVISSDENTITMLSKYNLYVGGYFQSSTWTEYGVEATGLQEENMKGYAVGQTVRKGTLAFSNVDSTYSGSIVEGYVNNYKNTIIEEFGLNIIDARLITIEELSSNKIGCVKDDGTCETSDFEWIYSTSYWTGSVYSPTSLWTVYSDGDLFADSRYNHAYSFGVRPVIVIKKSDIEVQKIIPVADGSLDEIGTIVTIGT